MMKQTINETYTLQIPDHFEVLSEAELSGMYRNVGDPFNWGVRDAENHIILLLLYYTRKNFPLQREKHLLAAAF